VEEPSVTGGEGGAWTRRKILDIICLWEKKKNSRRGRRSHEAKKLGGISKRGGASREKHGKGKKK